jgi:hypothetical protein
MGNGRPSCGLWLEFDYSKAAGYYSQLAGVLAGFSFLAISLLLSRQHRRDAQSDAVREHEQDKQIVTALGCALLGLIAAAALYALTTGETGCSLSSARAALSKSVLAGLAFGFSIYTALFATVQLVSAAALGAHVRFMVAVITPPAVVAFVIAHLDDLALALSQLPSEPAQPGAPPNPAWTEGSKSLWEYGNHASTWSVAVMLGVCLVFWFAGLRWRYADGTPRGVGLAVTKVVSAGLTYLPYASLALVAYAVWRTALISRLEPAAHIEPVHAGSLLAICIVVLVLQSVCLSLVRGVDRASDAGRETADVSGG